MIKVFDSIDESQSKKIESLLLGDNFAWFYNEGSILDDDLIIKHKNNLDTPQFTHTILTEDGKVNSEHYDLINYLFNLFVSEPVNFFRIKCNLLLQNNKTKKANHQIPHIDNDNDEYYSLIYYVNDTDGDTILFDNDLTITKKITPQKGKAILFKSNTLHAACNPIESYKRSVINFVFRYK